MKKPLFALALGLTALGLAQPLPEALKKAQEAHAVVNARLEVQAKARDLDRTLKDPLRTALYELQARQALELAEARLRRALAQAENEIVAAYTQVVEARLQVRVLEKALEVAELSLKATEVRVKGGGATSLDLLEAQNRAQEARKNLDQAQRALESAQAQLANLVGPWEPEPVVDLPGLPEAWLVEALMEENADLLQLRHSLALLKAQRALLDESFAARKDIDALEDQIAALATQLDGAASSLRVLSLIHISEPTRPY